MEKINFIEEYVLKRKMTENEKWFLKAYESGKDLIIIKPRGSISDIYIRYEHFKKNNSELFKGSIEIK